MRTWSVSIALVTIITGLLGFAVLPGAEAIAAKILFFTAAVMLLFTGFAALIGRARLRVY